MVSALLRSLYIIEFWYLYNFHIHPLVFDGKAEALKFYIICNFWHILFFIEYEMHMKEIFKTSFIIRSSNRKIFCFYKNIEAKTISSTWYRVQIMIVSHLTWSFLKRTFRFWYSLNYELSGILPSEFFSLFENAQKFQI